MPLEDHLRPVVLGALADDDHAPHVVATVERLAALHELRPVYAHACGHHLAAAVTCRVGEPYAEAPLPELTTSEAENAYIAWREAQPLLARAGVRPGSDTYILPGGPPVLALRDLARDLQVTALVAGRGTPRPRVIRFLAGDTAPAIARSFPAPAIFVDDAPPAFEERPVLCVLPPERDGWDAQLRTATTLAHRSGVPLSVHALASSTAGAEAGSPAEPALLPSDRPAGTVIAALAERARPALVLVSQPETSRLRAFARGSLPVDLLARCRSPLMTCPARAGGSTRGHLASTNV